MCAMRNSNSRRVSARLEGDSTLECRALGLTVMVTKTRNSSRMDIQEIAKTDVSGSWEGIGGPLKSVGGTSGVGSRGGWGSGSMKGDEEWYGQVGGRTGECHQRVLTGGGCHPQDTVSPSKAVAADCSGQSTHLNSEGSGFQAQCRHFLAVCLRASVFTPRASLSSSVQWA